MTQNLKLATILTLTSALSYAIIGAIVKHFALTVAAPIVVFITMSISLLLILPLILRSPEVKQQIRHTKTLKIHFTRTVFSLALNYLFYLSLHYLPLVNAVLLFNTAPLIIPFLGVLFFGKKIQHRLWIPIIVGFVGVAVVLQPNGHDFNAASFLALGSAVCMGMSISLVRFAAERGDNSLTTAFFFFFLGTIISGLVSIPFWQASGLIAYLAIIGAGALFFIVQITLTYALKYADAQFNNSLYYSNIIFAAILGMLFFSDYPDHWVWIGIALIVAGGIATIRVQHTINQKALESS
ncbi:MAG: DMT family transporter [Gammaproteobacteria bacterium]|nr:DMT family transporter [Gammaproteobacteria bacterium]